jgi:hypothetical protein
MILRRIAESVRARDWFTVVIELRDRGRRRVHRHPGIELERGRKFAAQEQSYLSQLRDEIANNNRAVEYQAQYTRQVVAAGQRALAYLDSDGDCASDCAGLLVDFFHSSQIWGSSNLFAKYRELERLGFPSDATIRDAVQAYYLYLEGWDAVNAFSPTYRETVRGHITPQAFVHLWGDCHVVLDGQLEQLLRDCVEDVRSLDAGAMLRDIHADPVLKQQLQFWLGQNILAEVAYPAMQAYGEAAMAAVSGELAVTR